MLCELAGRGFVDQALYLYRSISNLAGPLYVAHGAMTAHTFEVLRVLIAFRFVSVLQKGLGFRRTHSAVPATTTCMLLAMTRALTRAWAWFPPQGLIKGFKCF